MNRTIASIGRRVLRGEQLSRPKLCALVEAGLESPFDLFYWANAARTRWFGRGVRFCCIVPGKLGGCSEDCKWCAQSGRKGQPIKGARTPKPQILSAAAKARAAEAGCIGIVNSGRRPSQSDFQAVLRNAVEIRRQNPDLGVCASLGEVTEEQARQMAAAGVVRYNHNLETSRKHFAKVVTTHTYDDRLRTLRVLTRAGIKLCCGGLFGLGESWEDRIDLAITLRDEVHPEVVPMNFLHPIPGTALADAGVRPLSPVEILCTIAVFRLAMPRTDIKLAGGREINLHQMQPFAFYAGATSCITGKLLTTSGSNPADDRQMVEDMGLEVVTKFKKQ